MATKGECAICKSEVTKSRGANTHLYLCEKDLKVAESSKGNFFYIRIEGMNKDYWLDVMVNKSAKLSDLDKFLRDIWLECCGHLSAFGINGTRYESEMEDTDWDAKSMNTRLDHVLAISSSADYEYDFGSTTDLSIKVIGELKFGSSEKIKLLSRNKTPKIACNSCNNDSKYLCQECDEPICNECAKKHKCDEGMLSNLVNSPRAGVCGYS